MKIIIIPNEPNPNMIGRHYGIATALSAAGHEVHTVVWDLPQIMSPKELVLHVFTSLRRSTHQYESLTLHKFGRLPLFWPHVNGWLFKRQLRKLFHDTNADIIFTESYTNETAVPADLPFIYDLADDYGAPADVFGSIVYKLMFKLLGVRKVMALQCRNALAVTAVSDMLVRYAEQFNPRVHKLPNGVEADIIHTLNPQPNTNPHSLIYVSGFGQWSQSLLLLAAVTKLRRTFPDISLTLVGEGSEVPSILNYIAEHKAEDYIHYKGFIHDRQQVFNLISQHAIGLNISEKNKWRDAAHPMKVIEYSALGRKVVSTDLVGVQALQLPNIFMFSNDSTGENLRRAITAALKAAPKSYTTMQQQVLAEYDWQTIIGLLVTVFQSAIANNKLRRVVHVTPSYPPNLGGLEEVVKTLATEQSRQGRQVQVITAQKATANGFQDTVLVQRLKSFVIANTTIMPGLILSLLRMPRPSIVHLHITQAYTPETVWFTALLRRSEYIAHIHLDIPPSGFAGNLLKIYKPLLLARVLRRARYVIVFTDDQKQALHANYRVPLSNIAVIPNGVSAEFYYDKPRQLHAKPRLLFVGRLGYQKNLTQLLHALDGISQNFMTTLVGDGELKSELQQLTTRLKLQNVTFAGRKSGTELRKYYEQADVFVLPSEREGMPLVLLEAIAMGLPIVATDVVGNRDVVQDGKTGLLVPYDDAAALSHALQRLADSPKLYQRLHRNTLKVAGNYSWQTLAHEFDVLYESTS